MYYGFYLLAIALVVMIGQLAFALYQVASLVSVVSKDPGPSIAVTVLHRDS